MRTVNYGPDESHYRDYHVSYYSMYGHVEQLAQEITKGANAVEGVEATIYQVRFTSLAPLIALVMTQFFKQEA